MKYQKPRPKLDDASGPRDWKAYQQETRNSLKNGPVRVYHLPLKSTKH